MFFKYTYNESLVVYFIYCGSGFDNPHDFRLQCESPIEGYDFSFVYVIKVDVTDDSYYYYINQDGFAYMYIDWDRVELIDNEHDLVGEIL